MKPRTRFGPLHLLLITAVGATAAWSCEEGDDGRSISLLTHSPVSGAIFTTLEDGSAVNHNIYDAKEDVYLDGGPGPHAPQGAAGLPDGNYYFQVTDPSGSTLLSSDDITCREVRVADGVIAEYVQNMGCTSHLTGLDLDHGAVTVQLMPFDDTPNPGGVYKAWMTPVEAYDQSAQVNFHGFVPAHSKTDNFKAPSELLPPEPPEPPFLLVRKFHDANMNGIWDEGEEEITGWKIIVEDPLGAMNYHFTPTDILAFAGDWWTLEDLVPKTLQSVAILDDVIQSQYPSADPLVGITFGDGSGETHTVVYGNVGLGSIKACKFYDANRDGYVGRDEEPIPGWSFELTGVDLLGAPVGPILLQAGREGCATFRDLLPGEYTVTELIPGDEWHPTSPLSSSHTLESMLGDSPYPTAGGHHTAVFTNFCTRRVHFGTKGYWHNKNGLREMTDDDIAYVNGLGPYSSPSSYFEGGDEPFDGMFMGGGAVPGPPGRWGRYLEGTPRAEISAFLVDSNMGGDPREQLAQQLLAFIFNVRNRLPDPGILLTLPDMSTESAASIIADAMAIWASGSPMEQHEMAELLDWFNNNGAEFPLPEACPLR